MARVLVLDWLPFWLLLVATVRGAEAQCSRESFEVPCICLNDETCVSQTDPLTQGCSCLNGTEIALDDVEDIKGTDVRSLYVSGTVDSLEYFHRLFTGACDAVLYLKHTLIQSLRPLHELERVGGLVLISNERLINLAGLANLKSVTGPLIIDGNTNLIDIDELRGLRFVGDSSIPTWHTPVWLRGSFIVENNAKLHSVDGFHGLRYIWGDFSVSNSPNLAHVSEFKRLEIVNGSLMIENNTSLLSVGAFQNLLRIGGHLKVAHNEKLIRLPHFENLGSLSDSLIIDNNTNLLCVGGFSQLGFIGQSIIVKNNQHVACIPSFEGLQMVHSILIFGNDRLRSISGFDSLRTIYSQPLPDDFLKDPCFGSDPVMSGGMIVACNPNLRIIRASSAIEEIRGVLNISDNPRLKVIELESLWKVTNGTMITRNGVQEFAWAGPLPFITVGCKQSKSFLLHTKGGLKTKLAFKICTSDTLIYILMVVCLMIMLMITSIQLFHVFRWAHTRGHCSRCLDFT